ncbi:TetR family transcriptional regulator [Sphaerisporangium melleum]|uniref:TetR family transcriptional regulator n=1 Tax=Sphaerisporangium melleum TaxID=321316 RepID=A0A917VPT1_9ACTN|nr:TetR family transcriptional regulator [Sphaerisporangium melleum]GGL02052.1 TetR family transcriptional regulator [Sphaerisporangium melleum]GII72202.1 TetR family transcriptional regulator [Sphaerisporangium melleum]
MSRTLTAKGAATRQRIVIAAALLIRDKGASETSLDDIRAATSTSKSQLFHYFPGGRSEILVAVAEHEAAQVIQAQQPFLGDLSTWRSWQQWREAVLAHYTELGERCPLGALTSELGRSSPEARAIVTLLYDTWEAALTGGVQALTAGRSPGADASARARAILAAVQGGVVMLGATGRVGYLEQALTLALEPLRPKEC